MSQTLVTKDLKNPQALPKKFIERLAEIFADLTKSDEALSKKILKYIVDSEEADVLLTIHKSDKVAKAIGYHQDLPWGEKEALAAKRNNLFALSKEAGPEVWLRIGEVLETVFQHNQYFKKPDEWQEGLCLIFGEISLYSAMAQRTNKEPWSAMDLEKIFNITTVTGEGLLETFITPNFGQSMPWGFLSYSSGYSQSYFSDLEKLAEKHKQKILRELDSPSAERLNQLLGFLNECKYVSEEMLPKIVHLACTGQKSVKQSTLKLMVDSNGKGKPEYLVHLEKCLKNNSTSERTEAVSLLWKLYGSESKEILQQHLDGEKNEKIKQSISTFLNTSASENGQDFIIELPELTVETGMLPLTESFKGQLKELFERSNELLRSNYEDEKKLYDNPETRGYRNKPQKPSLFDEKIIDDVIAFVEGRKKEFTSNLYLQTVARYASIDNTADLELIHLVRLSRILLQLTLDNTGYLNWYNRGLIEGYRQKHPDITLRELDFAVASLPEAKPGMIALAYLRNNSKWANFFDWEEDKVWPLFAQHPEIIRSVLAPSHKYSPYEIDTMRTNAFKVLAMFPQVPSEFLPLLWELALGEAKSERHRAQKALSAQPDKTKTVVAALSDGKQTIRSAAAEWLGELGDREAIEPLKAAFKKEKNEAAKGIIMIALDKLDANVDEFLNREELAKEASNGLKKMPKGMEWFPLGSLPAIHWQDTGKQVEPEIVKWWLVQCVQQKSPICGPILRKYLSMCKPSETCALANYVLSSWITYDTAHPSHEEAHKKADADAEQHWKAYGQQWQQYYGSKEALYKIYYNNIIQTLLNSAIDQKGMLAIVAAAGDTNSVKMIDKYIRKYAGNKLAHSKAFIEVLSWIDQAISLQVLLSFANRFKTKAVKLAAEEHVQAKADRQGWTIDELADRTIPDGGFERPVDEHGVPIGRDAVLELDFGPRQFEVKLNDDLEPVVTLKGENKILKALPNPGKEDDEEKAKEAKKEFSDAKKAIKEVVKRQTERLYEALCTQRSWKYEDWKHYLADHPVVGRLCNKIVWSAFERAADNANENVFLTCFRPLEDGSLTNEKDEEVKLEANTLVYVAHACNCPAELSEGWINHFKDYDVTPLFKQFGRDPYTLPESKSKDSAITDFQGHMISSFKLRSKATKLGYTRGAAEDGGCFFTYSKQFGALELEATIEFTGSYLPEQDIATALKSIYFTRLQKESNSYSWNQNFMPLGKIPAVLLSECYNDLKQIAAEGSGFDADWEKKAAL